MAQRRSAGAAAAPAHGSTTILIVDNEDTVSKSVASTTSSCMELACSQDIATVESSCQQTEDSPQRRDYSRHIRISTRLGLALLYHAYLAYAIYYHYTNNTAWLWCDGLGFVIVCTALVHLTLLTRLCLGQLRKSEDFVKTWSTLAEQCEQLLERKRVQWAIYAAVLAAVLAFLIVDTAGNPRRLVSALGMVVLLALGVAFSKSPRDINWRLVTWGLVLQFVFGLAILRWEFGRDLVDCLGSKVNAFLDFTNDGSRFAFGYLVHRQPFIPGLLKNQSVARQVAQDINESRAVPPVVVFKALSVIYFFSFIVNILFYYGVVQRLTERLGYFLRITMATTACESLNAASNIFLGQAMAPMLIQPHISKLTLSEIHVVMVSGFATIAGTTMAAYITFGVSAGHLLSASVMSAPAALSFGKLFWPETEKSETTDEDIRMSKKTGSGDQVNVIDAATRGASEAGMLVLQITAIVVAFIAFVSFLNALFSFFGGLVGLDHVTFEWLLGKVFIPLAWLMGVPWSECESVGYLIGMKTVINEFIAYRELGILIARNVLSPRSVAIATYALCGFANPGSIGIQLAVLTGLCPQRKQDFARIVLRAFVAGSAACFLTACIAGVLYTEDDNNS